MIEPVDVLIQFGAVLAGVGGGLAGALWHDRWKKNKGINETRNNILQSLILELRENQEGLRNFRRGRITWDEEHAQFLGDFGLASTPAFESTVGGGNFFLLSRELQTSLSEVYHNFELFNSFMHQIMEFSRLFEPGPFVAHHANELIRRLNERDNVLGPLLDDLLPRLERAVEN